MKKRIFTLILALALCAGLVIAPASANGMSKAGENNIVSAGFGYTGFIDKNSSLWVWGQNYYGQLGNGHLNGNDTNSFGGHIQTVPVKVLDDVAAVSLGHYHTAAIKTDGSLWMWGDNGYGQLGNGTTTASYTPVKVLDNVAAVSCGKEYTAAIKTNGSLWMWGYNRNGQLGNSGGGNADHYGPIQTVPVKVLDNVAAVSCGNDFTAAITTDGTLWMWGDNSYGQLGNGTTTNSSTPVKVLDNVLTVSCGRLHTAAVKTDGTLWTWGDNTAGYLGNGTTTASSTPVKVLDNVLTVSCGSVHTAAVKTDGTLWTWGSNDDGCLGYKGNATNIYRLNYQTFPRQVTGLNAFWDVQLNLNGGSGTETLWTDTTGTIKVPTNPTREGYTFGGWYTDEALTKPYNFNNKVTESFTLHAHWIPITTVSETTGQSLTTITLNGNPVSVQTSVLQDANGNGANYVKLRDIAALLDGTGAQFNVDYRNGAIYVDSGRAYTTRNGTELKPIQGCDGSYMWNVNPVLFDGVTAPLEGIVLTDGDGGGHTFFKLRDLASALGFTVEWTPEQGVIIKTN